MDTRIIYMNDMGIISIVTPCDQAMEELGMIHDDFIEFIQTKDIPIDTPSWVIHVNDLPNDWTYRDAWVCDNNGVISVDLPKSRSIRMSLLKNIRDVKLKNVSECILDCQDLGNDFTSLKNQRLQLRNMESVETSNLNNLTTFEEIKSYLPEYLS